MTLNCRPGDLARVFRVTPGWEWAMDKIVTVKTLVAFEDGDPAWWLAEPAVDPNGGGSYRYALDSCLKPIRDPGDDAQDESLLWLRPVPTRERQQA